MFRYLVGIVLVQLITLGLLMLNAEAEPRDLALRAGLPALAIALLAALWFRSLSRADAERDLARTRLEYERQRERATRDAERERADLTLAAEREKADVARAAERTIRREERRVGRRASWQVGLAFAATGGMGVLFVLSELVTLGLLTLTAGGSALGGYLLRWRQTRSQTRSQGRPPSPSAVSVPPLTRTISRDEMDGDVAASDPIEHAPGRAIPHVRALPPPGEDRAVAGVDPGRRRSRAAPGRTGFGARDAS